MVNIEVSQNLLDCNPLYLKCLNESDFYGLSFIYNNIFPIGMQCPLLGASLKHGWTPIRFMEHPLQISHWGGKEDLHLTFNSDYDFFLKSKGYTNVVSVGAPFLYAKHLLEQFTFERREKSLLIMPGHTLSHVGGLTYFQDFFAGILHEIKSGDFREIAVCLHGESASEETVSFFIKNNIRVIVGAKHNDSLSLIKQVSLLSQFSHVLTNSLSSHVLYALASGCNIKIINHYTPPMHDLLKHDWYRNNKDVAEINIRTHSNANRSYPELFSGWTHRNSLGDLVDREIGLDSFYKMLKQPGLLFDTNPLRALKWNFKNKNAYYEFSNFIEKLSY